MKINKAVIRESETGQKLYRVYKRLRRFLSSVGVQETLKMSTKEAYSVLAQICPMPDNTFGGFRTLKERSLEVSVIVPAHNAEVYIEQCLDSILNQETDFDFEVIVIENASGDKTAEIAKRYFEKGKIIFLQSDIPDLSNARNMGIENASGKYLMFVDSDDYLNPGILKSMYEEICRQEADIAVCGYEILEGGRFYKKSHVQKTEVYETYLQMSNVPGFAWGKLYRWELFKEVGFPEHFWYEDTIICHKILPQASRMVVLPDAGIVYRRNSASITAMQVSNPRCLDTLWVLQEIIKTGDVFENVEPWEFYLNYLKHFTEVSWIRVRNLPQKEREAFFCVSAYLLEKEREAVGENILREKLDKKYLQIDEMFRDRKEKQWELFCRYEL